MRVTYGQTSRSGVIPLSDSFDVTGAITNTVEDQALVLDAIVGPAEGDVATLQATQDTQYEKSLAQASLKGAKLGIVNVFNGGNSEVDETFKAAQIFDNARFFAQICWGFLE